MRCQVVALGQPCAGWAMTLCWGIAASTAHDVIEVGRVANSEAPGGLLHQGDDSRHSAFTRAAGSPSCMNRSAPTTKGASSRSMATPIPPERSPSP